MNWDSEIETKPKKRKLWGWKVIIDNASKPEEECYVKDKEYGDYQGGKHRYRMRDDDGEIYYYILSDIDPNEGTESQLFAPLDWATNFAGCTSIEFRNEETGEYEYL